MKKLLLLTKMLLAVALLCVGQNAWGVTWVDDIVLNFDNGETYQSGWASGGDGLTISQVLISGSDYGMKLSGTKARDYSYDMNETHVNTDKTWKIEFDWAMAGINGTTHGDAAVHFYVYYDTNTSDYSYSYGRFKSVNKLFNYYIDGTAWNNTISLKNAANTEIGTYTTVSYKNVNDVVWFHSTIIGDQSTNKVKMTITKKSDSSTLLSETEISSFVNPRGISMICGKAGGFCLINNFKTSYDIDPYKTRAASAVSAYDAVKNRVMNSTVKSTLDGAKSALDAFGDDAAIAANVSGYISAVSALETANGNAKTSADNFSILNALIGYSKPAGYVAPSGTETVYTSNADVDPVALASSVRAAVVTAGTVSNNTDISAVIANKSFELGSSIGWTIAPSSDDSGINVTDGVLTINPNGNTVSQNVGTLPAGRYKLSAKAWSNGAKVYLIANDSHNDGTIVNGDNIDVEYTFTLTAEEEVTIGINSGDQFNGNAFVADGGKWWYRCDNFSLTYVDDDPLGRAQKALNDEIDAATDVKNAWTPRVGTTPFKYNSTYYDALVTELSEANAVKVGGSEDPDDYTTAKTELETAKTAIASSVLNEPASDKYYRLYLAEDGVSTGKNLNMLKTGAGNTIITEAPYPVKFVKSGENYIIENAYDYYFVTPSSSNSSWGTYIGLVEGETMEENANVWSIVPQEDGTFKMLSEQTSWKSWSWYVGTFSTDEGSKVAPYDNTRPKADRNATKTTWLCSEPVEVTDVNLAVNATTGWGTFIAPYDNLTPSTVKAYTVSHKDGNIVYFEENETGVLSANTPYILSTEEVSNVSVAFKGIANNDENTYSANGLVGLLTASTVPANSYILQYQAEKVGTAFYKLASDMTGTAYRCYLDLASVPTGLNARATVRMNIFGGITGVENVEVSAENALKDGKYLENGKIVIVKAGKKFSATGAKLY